MPVEWREQFLLGAGGAGEAGEDEGDEGDKANAQCPMPNTSTSLSTSAQCPMTND
ncbi:hypothetical protein LC574_33095 [Nostoc sp. CHAB 5715]|nr:hypothetical protein [Nostoc sp. CHAB 5715]